MSQTENEKKEYQRLASQMVEVWQKNITAMMNDSELIRTFLYLMQHPSFGTKDFFNGNTSQSESSTRPAPASDPRDAAITALTHRFHAMEHRIQLLEHSFSGFITANNAGAMGGGKKPPAKRGSSKSGKSGNP